SVAPSSANPQSVQVSAPGGTASVTLAASITEPSDGSPGDISFATPVTCALTPVVSGTPRSAAAAVSGGGVGGTLLATCAFANLAVNEYTVQISVGGDRYTGSAQTALSVFDPSLGSVTGGGVVSRNGNQAVFGLTARYLKNGRVQGDFTWREHGSGPDVLIQSTAIQSISIVGNAAVVIGEAIVNGTPHCGFQVIAVNNGSPGINRDQLALEITNPDGTIRPDLTFPLTPITGGNIQLH
ncbi:MAG TPA: post-COAP-1 domain-containing protein, partial [Bryobacteraceae bacterium]|nr:post-COAP-1 domain-containing protein [Bryobacteraceae bacterium]